MKQFSRIFLTVMIAILAQSCGDSTMQQSPSDTSSDNRIWYSFCMQPNSGQSRVVEGRQIIQMNCSVVTAVTASPVSYVQGRQLLVNLCRDFRPHTLPGGPYNLRPVLRDGDVAASRQEAMTWRKWACYN